MLSVEYAPAKMGSSKLAGALVVKTACAKAAGHVRRGSFTRLFLAQRLATQFAHPALSAVAARICDRRLRAHLQATRSALNARSVSQEPIDLPIVQEFTTLYVQHASNV